MSVLEVNEVSIRFGGVQALDSVNLTVNEWEIVGLIGPNGAGKTTLFNCITGFYKQTSGRISYRGEDVSELPPHKRAALGIGRTFQTVGLVKSMTVLENMLLAQHMAIEYGAIPGIVGAPLSFAQERALVDRAMQVLDFMSLAHLRDALLPGMPYGTLKMVEVAAVLATDPDLLLLDEPSAGVGPEESYAFGDRLLEMRRELGLTIVMIEHHVPLVVRVCDYIYVLNFGQLLVDGEPEAVRSHPEVVAAYLGGDVEDSHGAA
ncbi:MAG TPA: ABC transporter ATP-binding protein [Actinomycetota bacterium]|nr:ABC transporter ATP-binding protein [Actinomycetota bacterium]